MTITDETLMAFVDNELPAEEKAKIIIQIDTSAELAKRIENIRLTDALLVQSCRQIDTIPMPQGMMALLEAFPDKQANPAFSDQATILPFRKLRRITHAPLWQMAVAATVVLAIGLGTGRQLLMSPTDNTPKMITAQLTANIISPDNALYQILEKQPSSSSVIIRASERAVVTPIMTFRTADNGYCREFKVITGQTATRNVACKNTGKDAWIVRASATSPHKITAGNGQYQTATGPEHATVDAVIRNMIKGDALGIRQEADLIDNNWR